MKPEIFLCVQLFFFLTLALFLGSIFYSLISPDLMLFWVNPNLSRFFLLTEDCFNMNFKLVILNLALCFRQTDFPLPTSQSVDMSVWFGLLEAFCYMIWRYCVDRSADTRRGALQNEWPSVSFLSVCFARQTYFSMLFLHLRGYIADTKWGVFNVWGCSWRYWNKLHLSQGLTSWIYSCINTVVQKSILVYAISKYTFSFDFGFLHVKYLATESVCIWTFMGIVLKVPPVDPDENGHLFSTVWDISTSHITLLYTVDEKNWHTRCMLAWYTKSEWVQHFILCTLYINWNDVMYQPLSCPSFNP